MDLAVTSETVRCSYITRALNFSQGQRGDRLNKIRPVCSLMIPVPSNPQLGGPGAQGGGVCPPERQRVEVRRGHLPISLTEAKSFYIRRKMRQNLKSDSFVSDH